MRFSGRNEMVRFNNLVKMGNVGDSDEFLPLQYDVDATFRFLGNVVDGTYEAVRDYKNIIQKTSGSDIRRSVKKSKYCGSPAGASDQKNRCFGVFYFPERFAIIIK